MERPNLNKIIAGNLDKAKFQSKSSPVLPTNGWLDQYKEGGTYISDRAKATQFGQYKRGGGMFPEYNSYAPPRMKNGGEPTPKQLAAIDRAKNKTKETIGNLPIYSPDIRYQEYQDNIPYWQDNISSNSVEVDSSINNPGSYYHRGIPSPIQDAFRAGNTYVNPSKFNRYDNEGNVLEHELYHAGYNGRDVPEFMGNLLDQTNRNPNSGEHANMFNEQLANQAIARRDVLDEFNLPMNAIIPEKLSNEFLRRGINARMRNPDAPEYKSSTREAITGNKPGTFNQVINYGSLPTKKNGGGLLSRTVSCSNCGWSWKAVDGGKDVMTCHKCGGMIKMKQGGEWLNQYAEEGVEVTTDTTKYPQPTSSDSLRVYNSQIALNNFYNKEVKSGRFTKKPAYDIYYTNYDFQNELNDLKKQNLNYYRGEIAGRNNSYGFKSSDKEYKKHYNLSPEQVTQLELKGLGQTKSGNEYQSYYRDRITPLQNLAAPFALVDSRIVPQRKLSYARASGDVPGGDVSVYDYDLLAIKPWAMKTPQEKIEWQKKYGKPGFKIEKTLKVIKEKPVVKKVTTEKTKPVTNPVVKKQSISTQQTTVQQPVKQSVPVQQPVVTQQVTPVQTQAPRPTSIDYTELGPPIYAPNPYGGGAGGAFVGYRTKDGQAVYVKPEDYQRMGVPSYGKQYIENQNKKQKYGGTTGWLKQYAPGGITEPTPQQSRFHPEWYEEGINPEENNSFTYNQSSSFTVPREQFINNLKKQGLYPVAFNTSKGKEKKVIANKSNKETQSTDVTAPSFVTPHQKFINNLQQQINNSVDPTIFNNANPKWKQQLYEPTQKVKNAKAILSGIDLVSSPFVWNPAGFLVNRIASTVNATGDAYTSARYFMDGQWQNGLTDLAEAGLDLIPFRKGKPNTSWLGKGELMLSKTDKSLNKLLRFAKGISYADDFKDVAPPSKKENGGETKWLTKYAPGGVTTDTTTKAPSFVLPNFSMPRAIQDNTYRAPLINVVAIDTANKQRQQQAMINNSLKKQTYIKQGHAETAKEKAYRAEQLRKKAQQNSALAQTFGMLTPMGSNPAAGAIAANDFVNMNPLVTGPIMSGSRLFDAGRSMIDPNTNNPYFSSDNGVIGNIMGGLQLFGDIGMLRMGMKRPEGNLNVESTPGDKTPFTNFKDRNKRVTQAWQDAKKRQAGISTSAEEYRKALQQQQLKQQAGDILRTTGVEDPTQGGMYQAPSNELTFKDPNTGETIFNYEASDYGNFKTPELYNQAKNDMSLAKRRYWQRLIDERNKNVKTIKGSLEFGKVPLYKNLDPKILTKKNLLGNKQFPRFNIPGYMDLLGADMPMYQNFYDGPFNLSGIQPGELIPYTGKTAYGTINPNKYGGEINWLNKYK